ncbi:VWA domain-containing protein [Catenulispora sp. NL8]|uniref:VWA domain-containing protein n=1 Tax=Catenulispora pinistramenti TaxID=2705254 RepID=A0ABS5KJL0_9ACTN|nr:vWA domain-containing protein [Catenulispora pinistramenti]MBS2545516.1 VWA domain-containing protein [Catenulispora pinistramenti]
MTGTPHIHYGDAADAPTAPEPPAPRTDDQVIAEQAWLAVSADLTDAVCDIANRDDLIVKAVPVTAVGAPAMFAPAKATVEVDRHCFDCLDPESIRAHLPSDRYRYPNAWGALVHEAAHAEHSTWTPADVPATPSNAVDAAMLLEESRIEAAHLTDRPQDRLWLRAGTMNIVWPELSAREVTGRAIAGRAAALVLARVDAGVLTREETEPLRAAAERALGHDVLTGLENIWRRAHMLDDHEREAMLDLGSLWCEATGHEPDAESPFHAEGTGAGSSGGPSNGGDTATDTSGELIGEAIAKAAAEVASRVGSDVAARTAREAREAQDAAIDHVRTIKGARAAKKIFFGQDRSAIPTRTPTPQERGAAATLAKQLRAAAWRNRSTTLVSSELPPGRLRMRGALVRDAQRAAGAIPTAKPFTAVVRRVVEHPPLRVGIAVDNSGSMSCAEKPLASAAWVIATAVTAADPASLAAAVTFGSGRVKALTTPNKAPAAVSVFRTGGGDERFCEAIDVLDAGLGLSHPGTARLIVVVSDGKFYDNERRDGAQRVAHLISSGCAVLWLTLTGSSTILRGAAEVTVADPTKSIAMIGHAAVKALAVAR